MSYINNDIFLINNYEPFKVRGKLTYIDILLDFEYCKNKYLFENYSKINCANSVSDDLDNLKLNPIWALFYTYCIIHDIVCFVGFIVISISAVYVLFQKLFTKKIKNYIYFVSVVIFNCLSYYEILSVLSCSVIILTFSTVSSFSEDDAYDLSLVIVLSLIFFLIFLYFKFCGLFKSYYLLTSNSSSERTKRLILNDVINIFLIFLRIFLC